MLLNAADRYMARLIAVPLFSSLAISAMLLVLDPVVTAVHRVHLLLVEAAR